MRKITRGIWALDLLNDTVLIALLPSVTMLVGATVLLGTHWPVMGLVVGAGSLLYITVTVAVSLGIVAPAARLGNLGHAHGRRARRCRELQRGRQAFGAETREAARARDRQVAATHARTWVRGTLNGGLQGAMLVAMQAAMIGARCGCG